MGSPLLYWEGPRQSPRVPASHPYPFDTLLFRTLNNLISRSQVSAWQAAFCSVAIHATVLMVGLPGETDVSKSQFGGEMQELVVESVSTDPSPTPLSINLIFARRTLDSKESPPELKELPPVPPALAMPLQRVKQVGSGGYSETLPTATNFNRGHLVETPVLQRATDQRSEPSSMSAETTRVPQATARQHSPPSSANPQVAGLDRSVPPDFSANQKPTFPAEAIRLRLEGDVLLEVRISATGQVVQVKVVRSSGHQVLDQAAVEAVKKWSGKPASLSGVPVETVEFLPIEFRL